MEDNLSSIINTLKNSLNNQSDNNSTSSQTSNNITPEMIQNLASKLQNSNTSSDNSNSDNEDANSNESNWFSFDLDTIMKMKNIMETLNQKDDPRSNLLYSLKPYLRETRQKKLDQYVNLLKITKVSNLFKKEKGE